MEPFHLSEIEVKTGGHPALRKVREARGFVPQIFHLLTYKPEATRHLLAYTQAVMRGPSPLSPGWRELIAAFTSHENLCPF